MQQKIFGLVEEAANVIGEILRKSGFNMNYAPVLDIQNFPDEHAIGNRCYGENIEDVCKYAIPAMKALQNNQVVAVVKHFPGHGATKRDSHFFLPIIKASISNIEQKGMIPFGKAIEEGCDAIMVGHLIIKDIDKFYPASISANIISKYLREKYKYDGLVITDDLKMRAIKYIYGLNTSVKRAIKAGNDIVLFRYSYRKETRAIKNIIKLVKKGKLEESRINESVERIIKIKDKYNINGDLVQGINIEEINEKINKINNRVVTQF